MHDMKKLFKCELINGDVVEERLFREGGSPESVLDDLNMFQWPKGTWRIDEDEERRVCPNCGAGPFDDESVKCPWCDADL
jgi:hypothetical protein